MTPLALPVGVRKHLLNMSKLVSLSVASVKIEKLTIEEFRGPVTIRPQMHLLLRAPTGAMKSTILNAIQKQTSTPKRPNEIISEVTRAGLVGSIDGKTMQLVEGAAWNCRNNILLLDEFRFNRRSDDWNIFLQLLEDQHYSRKLGIFSADKELIEGDLHLKLKGGQISLKTRFACIIATMKRFQHSTSEEFKAFVNRCVPYEYDLEIDEIDKIISGELDFSFKELKPESEVVISKGDYTRIRKMVKVTIKESTDNVFTQKQNFARAVGDICRIHAITDNHDRDFERSIVKWKCKVYDSIGQDFKRRREWK
jgi:hypothetical protein